MNELTTFTNEEFGTIRTIQIDGEPYFSGKDVAVALGYKNPRDAIRKHVDEDDKNTVAIHDGIGNPNKVVINESGLYSLILSSKLPNAKRFKRWVTGDVLPTLRKTGRYEVQQATQQRPLTPDDYLRAAAIIATCKNERLPYALKLLERAGISIQPQIEAQTNKRDTTTANLINIACSEYGISLRAIERASGVYATQLQRIRRGESFPKAERAAIIREAIYRIVPDIKELNS